ncbi:hypothetical protein G6F65_015292 [Rhizopus arrhizus]|nr:hypothetical protein G6F65_015292 [Rhizopus arrhizus]
MDSAVLAAGFAAQGPLVVRVQRQHPVIGPDQRYPAQPVRHEAHLQLAGVAGYRARHAFGNHALAFAVAAGIGDADPAVAAQPVVGGDLADALLLDRDRQVRDLVPLAGIAIDVQGIDRAHRLDGEHRGGGQQQAREQGGAQVHRQAPGRNLERRCGGACRV